MATLTQRPTVSCNVVFELDESEVRALDALVGYGDDAFLKVFYEKLGEHYMKPHEKGLRSLFKSVREVLPAILARANAARNAFDGKC